MPMSTGAKIGVGCGVAALLVILLCGGFFGITAWMARDAIKGTMSIGQSVQAAQQYEQANPYTPPTDNAFTQARFDAWLAARGEVLTLSQQNEMLAKFKTFRPPAGGGGNQPTFSGIFGDMSEIMGFGEKTIPALRGQSMSFREYGFHLTGTMAAIRQGAAAGDPEMMAARDAYDAARAAVVPPAGTPGQGGFGDVVAMEGLARPMEGRMPAEAIDMVKAAIAAGTLDPATLPEEAAVMQMPLMLGTAPNGNPNAAGFVMPPQTASQNATPPTPVSVE